MNLAPEVQQAKKEKRVRRIRLKLPNQHQFKILRKTSHRLGKVGQAPSLS